jgi:hypothetical protein
MTPKQFDGMEPCAVGVQVTQNQTNSGSQHNNVYFIILMGDGVIPGDINDFLWTLSNKACSNSATSLEEEWRQNGEKYI